MQTQTATKTNVTNVQLMDLPLMKHFNESEITTRVENFRKGEKGLFWFLKLGFLIGLGYLVWQYVLPPVFQMLGQLIAVAATGVFIVFLIMMLPVIFKGLRVLTRFLHKMLIKHDPFAELENQKQKMVQNQQVFRQSKMKIKNLENDMMVEAKKSEEEANQLQTKIITLQGKVTNMKNELDAMVQKGGAEARVSDEYVNGNSELLKMLADSQRVSNKLTQAKDFITKYGTRAAVMKKLSQKLVMVEANMEIKIADFDATVEMLKKDFEFGQKANAATTAAKSAMGFTSSWERDYALEVITSTIASDIAITSGNLKDIDSLTNQYAMDSDELYANLNTLADNIRVGKDDIPDAKAYNNPEYKFTANDKLGSNGLTEVF